MPVPKMVKMVFIRLLGFRVSSGLHICSWFIRGNRLLKPAEVCKTELKTFLAILGTRMRAKRFLSDLLSIFSSRDVH